MLVSSKRHQFDARCTRDFGRFLFGCEASEVRGFPVESDACRPYTRCLGLTHTTKLRSRIGPSGAILCIQGVRTLTQITPAAVQNIAVPVIDLNRVSKVKSEHGSMQVDRVIDTVDPLRPRRIAMRIGMPSPEARDCHVARVNDRVVSDRSISSVQRYRGSLTVLTQLNAAGLLGASTVVGAERSLTSRHMGRSTAERLGARLTRDGDTRRILTGHRLLTPGGVPWPGVALTTHGPLAFNYTSTRREAA